MTALGQFKTQQNGSSQSAVQGCKKPVEAKPTLVNGEFALAIG